MKKSWILFFWLLSMNALAAQNLGATQQMQEAIGAYRNEEYDRAIALYEGILSTGQHSAALYYNLGNAWYKSGVPGKAILNYERALLLDPSDRQARENLDFVSGQIQPELEVLTPFFLRVWWEKLLIIFSAGTWTFIGLSLLWVSATGWSLWLHGRSRQRKKQGFAAGLAGLMLCILPLVLGFGRIKLEASNPYAIIMEEGSLLRVAPDEDSQDLLSLKEGWKVLCLDQFDQWHKIRLSNGEEGWVSSASLEKI